MRALTRLVLVLALAPLSAHAVQPDEILGDPVLESRARALSAELRCLVCQNQSIDDSDAPLARDLRIIVRERLKAGDSDAQVLDFVVARYGEFVLMRPRFSWRNALLWGAPALALLLGAAAIFGLRRRRDLRAPTLSAAEEARLKRLMDAAEEAPPPPSASPPSSSSGPAASGGA